MAKALELEMINTKYDLVSGTWFEYTESLGQWRRLTDFEIDQKIFKLLMKREDVNNLLTSDYRNRVKLALEMINGVNFNNFRSRNQNLQLIPFKNGVLDLTKNELLPLNAEYYFTHSLNINYDPLAKLSLEMIKFLTSISNNQLINLKVLRSFIKCVLLLDNQYQVALYLYGPGGTGKSTFEKLLISLVGNNNSTTLDLNDLNKQFSISKVVDKSLVLFSDVQAYTGDPSKLRLLISGDIMNAERKYKNSFDLQPVALVVLSSNVLWNPKDSSTGLQRRIIYIPVTTVPTVKDKNLFHYNLTNNVSSGTLADSLSGLVNWALANPESNLNLLTEATSTNDLINPDVLNKTNPLVDWVKSYLTFEPGSSIRVGSKSLSPELFLYPNYLLFCKEYGYKSLAFNNFSDQLLQQLNTLISPLIEKRKTKLGMTFFQVKLNKEPVSSLPSSESDSQDSSSEFKDFTE